MTSRWSHRVTIRVGGKARSLISFNSTRAGDLIISIKAAEQMRDPFLLLAEAGQSKLHGRGIVQQRYTLHRSDGSNTDNVIQHTLELDSGEVLRPRQITKSVKSGNFTHIFSRRYPNLVSSRYEIGRPAANHIELGDFNSSRFMLVTSLFAGLSDTQFEIKEWPDCNVMKQSIGIFQLIIIWSYIALPSHESGSLIHSLWSTSLTPDNCAELHQIIGGRLLDEFIVILKKMIPETSLPECALRNVGMFKNGL